MKRICIIISLFVLVFSPSLLSAQQSELQIKETDILYRSPVSDDYMKSQCLLDISYYKDKSDLPVIVWFHGGGLTGGRKEIPAALANKGYVVVGVGYRFSPKVKVPDCIDDAAAAIAWVFNNIEKYGGSKEKIYTSGHSAGGYLVMMTGLDKHYLKKYDIDADDIKAIVPYSGQAISHFQYRNENGMTDPLKTPIIDEFAPTYHVRGDAPPMLLILGDRELEMYGRYEENAYFVRMMKLNGHKDITLYEEDGYGHGDMPAAGHPLFLKFIRTRERSTLTNSKQ